MPTGERRDPYKNFKFLVEIDGVVQAGFSEASMTDSTHDPIEYREGNETPRERKLPGLVKYGNLTLKCGISNSLDFYNWYKSVLQGVTKETRRNLAIILMDEEGNPAAKWEFNDALPSMFVAPDIDGKGSDVAIETLVIFHEGMSRVDLPPK